MKEAIGQLLDPILDALGDFLSSPIIQLFLQAILLYILVLWLASAWWIFRDAGQRSRNVLAPYLATAPVILATPLLFLFVLLVWRIVRPTQNHSGLEEQNLAKEALRAELDRVLYCATCSRRVHEDWIICPTCRARLARVCPNCKRLVGLDWSLCAWCARDFERPNALAEAAQSTVSLREPLTAELPSGTTQLEGSAPREVG